MKCPRPTAPRGLITIILLVCLVVIAMVSATLLKQARARREMLRAEETRLQTEWLVESGLDRATARLAESGDYHGERWEIAAEALGGKGAGLVTIKVEPSGSSAAGRSIRVVAEYPRGAERAARQHRVFSWEGPAKAGKSQ